MEMKLIMIELVQEGRGSKGNLKSLSVNDTLYHLVLLTNKNI